MLIALLLAQCFAGSMTIDTVDAGVLRGATIFSNREFVHDMTLTGDLQAPWLYAGTVFVSGYVQSYGSGAIYLRITRGVEDPNAGVVFLETTSRAPDAAVWSATASGVEVARLSRGGSLHASTIGYADNAKESAFMDVGGNGGSLGCRSAPTGCITSLNGGMVNNSRHGAITVGNYYGRANRLGGQQFAVQTASNSDDFEAGGGLVVDSPGNVRVGQLLITRLHSANFPQCGVGCADGGCGAVPKIEFDNSPTTEDDGTGTFNGVIGAMAFNADTEELWVCTTRSWKADGGYEHLAGAL